MDVSNVAPPHISSENRSAWRRAYRSATRSMSDVRIRVASSDWWASRIVVSVTSSRLLLAHPLANFSGPSSLNMSRVPGGVAGISCGAASAEYDLGRRAASDRQRLAFDLRVAVDDDLGDVAQQLGRPVAARFELEQLRRLVDEPRRRLAGQELRVRDQVEQERDVRLHAADAELLQAPLHPPGRVARTAARSPSP